MLIGIMGKMGTGKTLTQSILGFYLAQAMKVPLNANYGLKNATLIKNKADIWDMKSGIFCFDEIWLTLDSRLWKDNTFLTRWINQTRKKNLLVFYTTQHIRQVELRVRNATDILIFCERLPVGMRLNFIDWQYRQLGRRYLLKKENLAQYFHLYNTYEVLEPIK